MWYGRNMDPFEDDELYKVDGELLNFIVHTCKYFGRVEPNSRAVVNFILSNLLQMIDNNVEPLSIDEKGFRSMLKKLGIDIPNE